MIEATVKDCRDAYIGFHRIGEEIRLPEKAAWRVSRLTKKLKVIVTDYEERQFRIYRDAGGVEIGNGIQMELEPQGENESDGEFRTRRAEHFVKINELSDRMRELNKEIEKIDYDPIPRSLFQIEEKDGKKRLTFSPNDLANAGEFITDDTKKDE